jgi:hypothetical protein
MESLRYRLAAAAAVSIAAAGAPSACADDPRALKDALRDVDPLGEWVYNDVDAAFAAARASGKPLLAVFRCVP